MEYKPDFEDMVPRMEAWWRGEVLDRACVAVYAPNGIPRRDLPQPATLRERWTDPDYLFESKEAEFEATYYGGEAIPVFRPGLGPDTFAAFLGAPLHFQEDTSWSSQTIANWDNTPPLAIDEQSSAWKWYLDMYRRAAERAPGRYLVAPPDCHSGGDCLLAMRGGAQLCLDLYDHPEAVRRAMAQLEIAVVKFHEAFFPLVEETGQRGHTSCLRRIWSPGRSQMVQLDLLALISPAQFRDFFYGELEVQMRVLDSGVFHLDGPDAVKHLPALYELIRGSRGAASGKRHGLAGIQWVYGAGNGPMTKWLPLLKGMQQNGANLDVSCDPDEVEPIMRALSSRGLFLETYADSKEDADDLVALVRRLTHD